MNDYNQVLDLGNLSDPFRDHIAILKSFSNKIDADIAKDESTYPSLCINLKIESDNTVKILSIFAAPFKSDFLPFVKKYKIIEYHFYTFITVKDGERIYCKYRLTYRCKKLPETEAFSELLEKLWQEMCDVDTANYRSWPDYPVDCDKIPIESDDQPESELSIQLKQGMSFLGVACLGCILTIPCMHFFMGSQSLRIIGHWVQSSNLLYVSVSLTGIIIVCIPFVIAVIWLAKRHIAVITTFFIISTLSLISLIIYLCLHPGLM